MRCIWPGLIESSWLTINNLQQWNQIFQNKQSWKQYTRYAEEKKRALFLIIVKNKSILSDEIDM